VLFGVESFDEGEEFATMATAAKNRLLRMSHPDRARQHQEALWQLRNEATAHINVLWQDIKPLLLARAQQRASAPAQAQGAQRHAAAAAALEVVAENADACLGVVSTGGQGSGSSIKVLQSHTHTQTHTHTTHTHTHTHTQSHSQVLQSLVSKGELLHSPFLNTYIGFGEYLSMKGCVFIPLGTNRAVNQAQFCFLKSPTYSDLIQHIY
jgi:hypothetical protein